MLSTILLLLMSLSVSGSLVIILIWAICLLMQKKLSQKWQYYIWIAAIVRLMCPFSPEKNLIGFLSESLQNETSNYENLMEDDNRTDTAYEYLPDERNRQKNSSGNLPDERNRQKNSNATVSDTLHRQNSGYQQSWLKTDTKGNMQAFLTHLTNKLWEYRLYLCILWLTAALLLFLRKITVYQDFIRFIRAGSVPVDDIECLEMLSGIEVQLGIQKPIDLWSSQMVSSPMLVGFGHPCIILPEKADRTKPFVYYTMLHELTHYKRRDMYYKWLVQLVLCIYWFHPFVYVMARQINRLCELSCDETVTACLESGGKRKEYAATLLTAMSKEHNYKEQVASLTLTENKKLLKERLEFIMRRKETTASTKLLTVILTASVTAVSIYSGSFQAGASAGKEETSQADTYSQTDTSKQKISDDIIEPDSENNAVLSIKSAKNKHSEITAKQADEMALALTNKIWVWEWVEFFVPYMSEEGAKKLASASKHAEWAGYRDHTTGKKLKFTKKQVRAARKHTPSSPLTSKELDSHALMIMQSNGDWDCISFMLPYMTKKGIRAVTQSYNSKHGDEKKRAADYYG